MATGTLLGTVDAASGPVAAATGDAPVVDDPALTPVDGNVISTNRFPPYTETNSTAPTPPLTQPTAEAEAEATTVTEISPAITKLTQFLQEATSR